MFRTLHSPAIWAITLAAAGILMVTMGIRQSFGLFIAPIDETTGLGVVAISFALAVGQFTWGAIQPIAGAVADRYGPRPVLLSALLVLAVGCAATPFVGSGFGLVMLAIGMTDILFALDSIPAIYGLTNVPYIVFATNAFASYSPRTTRV